MKLEEWLLVHCWRSPFKGEDLKATVPRWFHEHGGLGDMHSKAYSHFRTIARCQGKGPVKFLAWMKEVTLLIEEPLPVDDHDALSSAVDCCRTVFTCTQFDVEEFKKEIVGSKWKVGTRRASRDSTRIFQANLTTRCGIRVVFWPNPGMQRIDENCRRNQNRGEVSMFKYFLLLPNGSASLLLKLNAENFKASWKNAQTSCFQSLEISWDCSLCKENDWNLLWTHWFCGQIPKEAVEINRRASSVFEVETT